MMKGMKRLEGEKKRSSKMSISMSDLFKIFGFLNIDSIEGLTLASAFITAEICLLRASEFSVKGKDFHKVPLVSDLFFIPSFDNCSCIRIRIKASKTDIFRQDFFTYVTLTGTVYCPVEMILRMLNLRGITSVNYIARGGEFLFEVSPGEALTYGFASRSLKWLCSAAGILGDFSLISFHRGGTTLLTQLGCPDFMIKTLGRWR